MGKIQQEFVISLESIGKKENFQVKQYNIKGRRTDNIVELSGKINCLVYFHIRTEVPLRWGVTKSRIEELKNLDKKWFLVFLYEPQAYKGFLLTKDDTQRHIKEDLWPLGRGKNKNEYKIRPGRPLQHSKNFKTLDDFTKFLKAKGGQ